LGFEIFYGFLYFMTDGMIRALTWPNYGIRIHYPDRVFPYPSPLFKEGYPVAVPKSRE